LVDSVDRPGRDDSVQVRSLGQIFKEVPRSGNLHSDTIEARGVLGFTWSAGSHRTNVADTCDSSTRSSDAGF
jgi:hypothetical protein